MSKRATYDAANFFTNNGAIGPAYNSTIWSTYNTANRTSNRTTNGSALDEAY